ncbi:FAD-dependent thymidylate synthase [Aliarcobacter cryaerophilus]|uniref:FAD-dependent thymidylate synthase n=1 Tax=Aliarcobacter cryaerophilus TaxID=28198 RepID=UPI0021B2FEE5|nr:FAD-dependent thymidylate synthase [Aliarcobacter cryaerophilus]MCT7513711.1 FAD-dependent thymidylate synthase [Aliarcobacter cryaerophilus]
MELINKKENIFGDDIAFVEQYDFSTANMSEENRIKAITTVASICYQNPKAVGSESLYNRLLAESKGLPSSSFEFVPVFLTIEDVKKINSIVNKEKVIAYSFEFNVLKFGEMIEDGKYLLTNLRALIADVGEYAKEFYNTPEECEIIKQYFKVFLYKVDLPIRSQMVRHRVSWQELSRRYVSGERVPFEFYISKKMENVESFYYWTDDQTSVYSTDEVINICLNHYKQALEQGVKPQEARRIIPQTAYTQIWGAFMPKQLDNYFKLRLDEHSQWEIRQTALAMQNLIKGEE